MNFYQFWLKNFSEKKQFCISIPLNSFCLISASWVIYFPLCTLGMQWFYNYKVISLGRKGRFKIFLKFAYDKGSDTN